MNKILHGYLGALLFFVAAAFTTSYAAASIVEPQIAVTIVGVGFPYIPPNLWTKCGQTMCIIRQETSDLIFELAVPNDLIYGGVSCTKGVQPVFERFVPQQPRPVLFNGKEAVITLVGAGKCESQKIQMTFRPKKAISDDLRDEAMGLATSWYICALSSRDQVRCAMDNTVQPILFEGGLKRQFDQWR